MTALYYIALIFFLILCGLLCLLILVQESRSSGLGVAFGGEASDSVFGTATADILKRATGWLIAIFMAASLLLSIWTSGLARREPPPAPVEIERPIR
jgi:preprotein translocase subunit SecG